MKDVFLIYDTSCFYEIVTLNYFMSFSGCDMVFCSLDGKPIKTMEGFTVNADMALTDLDKSQVRSFIVPGGNVSSLRVEGVYNLLRELKERGVLMAAICAGVDILDEAGILRDIRSTHSTDFDVVHSKNVITARANAYVDFAIEAAKALDLFVSETDLQETSDFWKNHKRMQ